MNLVNRAFRLGILPIVIGCNERVVGDTNSFERAFEELVEIGCHQGSARAAPCQLCDRPMVRICLLGVEDLKNREIALAGKRAHDGVRESLHRELLEINSANGGGSVIRQSW